MAVGAETLVMAVKTDGITTANTQVRNLGNTAENTEKKVQKLVDSVSNMVKQFTASVSGTKALTDALSVVNKSTSASDAAMKSLTKQIEMLGAQVGVLATRMQAGSASVRTSTVNIQHHTSSMTEAHAAARGLTGALGALWLTYGSIAPLAAGAAIGASMKAVMEIGVQLESTLENIRIKGENTAAGMQEMRQAIADLGQGAYGPLEVAAALETLTLAGLKAKDAVNAIGAAQNLALVGGTDINQAAEALVTIGTAVGATAKEYDYLADGISKTANISLASVESIAQAVKRASVVNKLYGASFEDILTQTAALAQLGIKNTAAGTAITNFYANAMGGTEKANKALEQLGMSFQDATGKAKPLTQAFGEFTDKLNQFDLASQKKIIMDIFGERALRDVEGLRDLTNQAAISTEKLADGTLKYKNRLEEVRDEIEKSAGTSALQAAQQALTTENQMKSMVNTLKTSFGGAFAEIEPQVRTVVRYLKEAFASEDFKNMVGGVAKAFAWMAEALASNIGPLTAMVEGMLAYATITAGGALFTRLIPVLGGVAIQMGLVAKGTTAATIATTAWGRALTLLPGIGLALGAITAAVALYTLHSDKAASSTSKLAEEKLKLAGDYNTDYIKSLEEQSNRLDRVNAKLAIGLTLQQAELQTTKELALEKERNYNKDAVDAAQAEYDSAKKEVSPELLARYNKNRFSYTAKEDFPQIGRMLKAQEALNTAKNKAVQFDEKSAKLAQDIIDKTKQQQEQLEINARTAEIIALGQSGEQTYAGKEDKGAAKALSFLQEEELQLKKVAAQYDAKTRAVWASYAAGEKVAADSRQAAVMVNKEEGKYLSEKVYLQQLSLAKAADEAKLNYDRAMQYAEIGQKISNVIEGEKERAALAAKGEDSGKLTAQIVAMGKYTSASKEQLAIDIKRAELADKILEANDNRKRLESATKGSEGRAEQYADELATLEKYGVVVKQTAIEFAKAEIAKRGFTEDSAEGSSRIAAAGLEDYNAALLNLGKTYYNLQKSMREQDGLVLEDMIGAEQTKVAVLQNTAEKAIEFENAKARAAIIAQMEVGKITAANAADQLASLSMQMDMIKSKLGEKFSIDFKVAGLKDVADIFNNMADAADRLGSKFEGPVKALDAFTRGFDQLAKVEKAAQGDSSKFAAERVGAYATMLDGAKSFFHEGTTGYKALERAAQIASAVQLAMNAKTLISNAATTISGVAAGAAQMFAQSGFGGFAGVAAMMAVMAGLGFSGGGSSYGVSAQDMQKSQGTGSVFGDSSAKSESISKSLDLLEENSDMMLPLTNAMLKSLQNIEASMAGLGNLIAGNSGVSSGADLGIATGVIGKSLGGIWGKTKQEIVDAGIQFGGALDALQQGIGYSQYASVNTTKSSFFGLKKKTTNSVQTQGLDADLANQFGMIFTNLEETLKSAASGFGKTGTEVGDALANMVIEETKLSLKDLKGDELTAAINAVISKTMDDIAQTAFPGLDAFRKVGEGYAETVIRVSSGIEQADVALEQFNIKAVKYTDIVNKQGDVAAEIFTQSVLAVEGLSNVGKILQNLSGDVSELADTYGQLIKLRDQMFNVGLNGGNLSTASIKGAGGLDSLKDGLSSFQENFFTDAEQNAMAFADLTKQFGALGLSLPTSKDALKELIIQTDKLGTEAGNKLVGQLLTLTEAFSDATSAAEELEKAAQKAADDLFEAAMKLVSAAQSALQKSVNQQKSVLKEAYDAQVKAIKDKAAADKAAAQVQLDAAKETLTSITKVFDSLSNALKSTEVESDAINAAKRKSAQSYLASIAGTDLTKATGLDGALESLSKDSIGMFSTFEDYAFDQAKTANLIEGLKNQAGVQKSFAELTVERLEGTITAIEEAAQDELDKLEEQHEENIERLDNILEKAQEQIDILNGVYTALMKLPDALANFAGTFANATAVKATNGGASSSDAGKAGIESIYKNLLGRTADAAGLDYWLTQYNKGSSLENIAKAISMDKEFKGLQGFAVGTNYVTEDMPAMIHEGERVMPKADNVELMRRLDDTSGNNVGGQVASLKAEINDLKEVIRAGQIAQVQVAKDQWKLMRDWDQNGLPEEREAN